MMNQDTICSQSDVYGWKDTSAAEDELSYNLSRFILDQNLCEDEIVELLQSLSLRIYNLDLSGISDSTKKVVDQIISAYP